MRLPSLCVLAFALVATAARAETVDVIVQAGHEGRPQSCETHVVKHCNLGATGAGGEKERSFTPIVADAVAANLRAAGLRVARRPADYDGTDVARAAVFIHFDGAERHCTSGASVGFPPSTPRAFAEKWERAYRAFAPTIPFVGFNISDGESEYYDYKRARAPGKMLLLEIGEISCPAQVRFMQPRLRAIGAFIASFVRANLN